MSETPQEQQAREREFFRELIHTTYGYKTHEPEVDRFHRSQAKTKIVSCPARTSKSYAAVYDVLPDIFYHGARAKVEPDLETLRIWIVCPNYELAKEFDYFWEALVERKKALGFDYRIVRKAKSPGQGNMIIHLNWGSNSRGQDVDTIITVRSAANEKVLQSEEVDIAILSEAARLEEIVWSKYLSNRVGRSIWPTTPDVAAAWIYKEIEQSKANPSLKVEHFQFTPRANPKYKYDRYWVEHQKAELRVDPVARITMPRDEMAAPSRDNGHDCFDPLVACNAMKDDGFAEQFGGHWTFHRGRVVPIRKETSADGKISHVLEDELPWFKWCDVHVAFDYGFTDPAVVGFWLVSPQQVVLRSSIYEAGLTPDDLVKRVHAIIEKHDWHGRITRYIGDPKKPEVCQVFRDAGLPIWDIDKRAQADRKAGHLELMNYLSINPVTGMPWLMIHAENRQVIREFETLRYNDRARDPYATNSLIGRDDAYDMTRYFVMSHPPIQQPDVVKTLKDTDFDRIRNDIIRSRKMVNRRTRTVGIPRSSGMASVGM